MTEWLEQTLLAIGQSDEKVCTRFMIRQKITQWHKVHQKPDYLQHVSG